MVKTEFDALMLRREGSGLAAKIERLSQADIPDGEVLVKVDYSSLNFKDAMAIGDRGIIRNFPAVPGIDFAGTVEDSSVPTWKKGDSVIATGWGIGERTWGGLAEYARVKGEWLLTVPVALGAKRAMAFGTAGLTAMLCVDALETAGATPDKGEILVTGASGGVGSVAVALLSRLGYTVVAMSGKSERAEGLRALGASRIVSRTEYSTPSKPGRFVLEKEAFQAAVDTVGGMTLASVLARIAYRGAVAACGLVGGVELDTHVFPFIIRGVNLLGIDSVRCPVSLRQKAWSRLGELIPAELIDSMTRTIPLEGVVEEANRMLLGGGNGRVVVTLKGR